MNFSTCVREGNLGLGAIYGRGEQEILQVVGHMAILVPKTGNWEVGQGLNKM